MNIKELTLGEMKEAMLMFVEATNPSALRRVTKSVIAQYESFKEAEAISKEV